MTQTLTPPDATPGTRPKRKLYEAVFEAIAVDILQGTLPTGSALPTDSALCTRFGVSRTVIREAIQHLSSVGLLDVRHGAGTYINGSRQWDLLDPQLLTMMGRTGTIGFVIDDLLDIRRMFEVEAATLAAKRATPDDIRALEALLVRMRDPATTEQEHVELNLEFHGLLVQASHNRILQGLREQLRGVLTVMMNARHRQADAEMRTVSTAMHQMILDSIRERRPDRAQAVMLAHIQGAERSLQHEPR
ncbi:Transcriptional regulator, GntR family [plant metagenome]|uniref:Transcriptional regulator, GntR family n=1 Tax=plant metagenome TaxID=1297885 RepID=A0A484TZW9_9ZZZZ